MEEGLSTPKNGSKLRRLLVNNNVGCRYHNQQQEDRISSLFDPLLVEILSLLPIESAAATSVLSRRWRYLWTQITSLRIFSDKPLSAVNHILPQLTSPQIRVLTIFEGNRNSFISSCFDHIRSRDDVEEIEVSSVDDSTILVPAWVFQCRSLVSLELFGQWNFGLVNSLYLPKLKKLSLEISYSD